MSWDPRHPETMPSTLHGYLRAGLFVTLSYAITAYLTVQFFPSTHHAVAIWPAAGIALAGLMAYGPRIWPSVFIGHGLFLIALSWPESLKPGQLSWSLIGAIGPTLQALVIALVINPLRPDTLRGRVSRMLKMAIYGVLGTTIAASAAHLLLFLHPQDLPAHLFTIWLTHWVGDAIGVLLFAPTVFLLTSPGRVRWAGLRLQIALPLLGAASVISIGIIWFQHIERERIIEQVAHQAELNADLALQRINSRLDKSRQVARFIRASQDVTTEEFRRFATDGPDAADGAQALIWLDLSPEDERTVPSRPKVREVFPKSLDFARLIEQPALQQALRAAESLGHEVMTPPLVSKGGPTLVGLIHPLLNEPDLTFTARPSLAQKAVGGFVIAIADINLATASFRDIALDNGISTTAHDSGVALLATGTPHPAFSTPAWTERYELHGREWLWQAYPAAGKWHAGASPTFRVYLVGALVGSVLFVLFVMASASQKLAVETEVVDKTAELVEQRRKLDIAMDLARLIHWELLPEADRLIVDDGFFRMLGISAAEGGGYNQAGEAWVQRFVHPDDRERILRVFHQLGSGNREEDNGSVEFRLLRNDGTTCHVIARFDLVRDKWGDVERILGATQDITSLKTAQFELSQSLHYNRSIVDSSQDCLKIISPDGIVLDMHENGRRLMQIPSLAAIAGKPWVSFWHRPEDREALLAAVATAAGGGTGHFSGCARTMGGDEKWWDVMVTPIEDVNGQVSRLLAVSRDISNERESRLAIERLNAELENKVQERTAALARSEERYRELFESSPIAMWSFDENTLAFESVNEAALRQYGYSRAEFLSMMLTDIRPQEDRAIATESLADKGRGLVKLSDVRHIRKDGSILHVDVTSNCLRQGRRSLRLVAATDVSERHAAERDLKHFAQELSAANALVERERASLATRVAQRTAELQQANADLAQAKADAEAASRAKSAFLATMSHEIRTPMNGIVGMVEVLAHEDLPESQATALRTIRESAFSLLTIIDDILDFSKIEAGRIELERRRHGIGELAESVCDSLSGLAERKNVTLDLSLDPDLPQQAWTDPTRLRQILNNLLGNAIKFSSGREQTAGHVRLKVGLNQGHKPTLIFSVMDNGIGIAPESLPKLFTSFTQSEASTTRVYGGTGLGLAISQRLAGLMGGVIKVRSEQGRGSVFSLRLPLDAVEPAQTERARQLHGLDCGLLESAYAEEMSRHLKHAGAKVVRLANAEAALGWARRQPDQRLILIQGPMRKRAEKLSAAFSSLAHVRHVMLQRWGEHEIRQMASGDVLLRDRILRGRLVIEAVATAAGRLAQIPTSERKRSSDQKPKAAPSIADARAKRRLILVAEDDLTNQAVILRQLALMGHAAEVASNGQEAFEMWHRGCYCLLLTDLHMPEMDGYELTRKIRQHERESEKIPVVALTADALPENMDRARKLGMNGLLTKPLQFADLRQALDAFLPGITEQPVAPKPALRPRSTSKIDMKILAGIIGDDAFVMTDILQNFLSSARSIGHGIRVALEKNDQITLTSLTHRLKSSSRTVGALELGDCSAELENAARARSLESQTALGKKLLTFLQDVLTEVEGLLAMPTENWPYFREHPARLTDADAA